jgi:hypothetical protein
LTHRESQNGCEARGQRGNLTVSNPVSNQGVQI